MGKDPRKGVDKAWASCQDKLLDVLGPFTRIFDIAEAARIYGSFIDPEELTLWTYYNVHKVDGWRGEHGRLSVLPSSPEDTERSVQPSGEGAAVEGPYPQTYVLGAPAPRRLTAAPQREPRVERAPLWSSG
ncbi:hypothetical protein NDU88_003379 [Pleurodeles waltl]|uniref:Uncharacterized protein n=1 Tax=Pleurodeles waltl TaxID=8319 RepID=A0AAV7MQE6_PLEWA|nr:hypothetical protein NDU88_003379 [Pleurodeles waltl]